MRGLSGACALGSTGVRVGAEDSCLEETDLQTLHLTPSLGFCATLPLHISMMTELAVAIGADEALFVSDKT